MTGLAAMAGHVARRVERLKKDEPVEALRGRPLYARVAHPLPERFKYGADVVEVSFVDSEGVLLVPRESATPAEAARRADAARRSGAAVVAIWVERNFHAGDYAHLEAARAVCPELVLIARDVVLDAWQLERARAAGADAVELSSELLGPALGATADAVRKLGLTPVTFGPGLTVRPV